MFSQEFFVQRSFEVVWAVFRVAEHATRLKIKQVLEDKAVDYLASKDLASLDGLEEMVRLGAQVKDINKVNSSVILREIGNLRSAILELNDCKMRMIESAKNPETAPNIEESFSRPPMRISEIIRSISDSLNKSQPADGSAPLNQEAKDVPEVNKQVRQESGKDKPQQFSKTNPTPIAEVQSAAVFEKKEIFYAPAPSQNQSPARDAKSKEIVRQESPASAQLNENKSQSADSQPKTPGNNRFEASIGFKERNEILVKILSKRTLCHIKDVIQSMPGISERTIRYDVQRLVDKGIIERIGTGGPNSFFRLKK